MAVIKVNRLDTQCLEALLARLPDVFRIGARHNGPVLDDEGELCGEEDVVPLSGALEPLADALLAVAVDVGRVPEALADLVGAVEDGPLLLGGVLLAVGAAEAHGTEANSRDWGTVAAKEAGWKGHDR